MGPLTNFSNEILKNELLMSHSSYVFATVVLFLIGFFGFFLNILVIILMLKDKQLWTPLNIIIFNLVCGDFSVSILGNPWTLISAISHGWIWGTTMCVIYGFFMSLLGISSITGLSVLAFERFLIVSRPFQRHCMNRKNACFIVIGIWFYALCLTVPPLLGWGKYGIEAANISCSVNWEDRSSNAASYIMYLFFFGLILPLIVIVYSYVHIIITMRMKKMQMGQVCRVEAKIAYIVLVMILAFLIAWTPYAIMALLVQFGDPSIITPSTGVLPALIAKSSICYNPIIYVGLNSQFRQSMKRLLRKQSIGVHSTYETYGLAESKYMSQTNTPERKVISRMREIENVEMKIETSPGKNGCCEPNI
ncbi:hypothetical protein ABEB36_013696 [Hypothenemus hampei]|uniref:G-protein coupled receptors family 1 profile domain-containing protein n=1 Tax=Hypothenemus hampei TaxID=57062 RepID=A0ABD1E9I4_HYPHA